VSGSGSRAPGDRGITDMAPSVNNSVPAVMRTLVEQDAMSTHGPKRTSVSSSARFVLLFAGSSLPRGDGVRFPNSSAFVTSSFQAFIGDFRPFFVGVVALWVCLSTSFESTAFDQAPVHRGRTIKPPGTIEVQRLWIKRSVAISKSLASHSSIRQERMSTGWHNYVPLCEECISPAM
jgi:hypothetical protein